MEVMREIAIGKRQAINFPHTLPSEVKTPAPSLRHFGALTKNGDSLLAFLLLQALLGSCSFCHGHPEPSLLHKENGDRAKNLFPTSLMTVATPTRGMAKSIITTPLQECRIEEE